LSKLKNKTVVLIRQDIGFFDQLFSIVLREKKDYYHWDRELLL